MSKIKIHEADQLTVRDVLHAKLSTLDATATIADVRAASRRAPAADRRSSWTEGAMSAR